MKLLASLCLAAGLATCAADEFSNLLAPLGENSAGARSASGFRATAPVAWAEELEVLAALKTELQDRFPVEGELRVNFARPWIRVRLPGSAPWHLSLIETPPGGLASSMIVQFSILQGERKIGEWTCLIRSQLWRPALVATHRLEHGVTLEESLFTTRPLDFLREPQPPVPEGTDLNQYELSQTVSAGRPLAWRDIAAKPLIRKGQVVEVSAGEGALAITMKAVAQANGGAGDIISVRNLESRRDFPARVTGANTAQVLF